MFLRFAFQRARPTRIAPPHPDQRRDLAL